MCNPQVPRRALVPALALVLLGPFGTSGCKSSDDAKQKPADKPQEPDKPGHSDKPDSAKPGPKPKPATLEESAVKAMMDKWLAAQNDGDFATYEKLYAKRLEGVRRSGDKVVRLNRAGWVKERKRMFKRKMMVEMTDIDIDVFTQTAIVTFTQRWASGKYEDIGPKQIVVVREGGALRIAREEMLQSTLIGDDKKTALADQRFAFVIEAGKHQYAVLEQLGATETGKTELISKDDPVIVSAKVAAKDLPEAVGKWRDTELRSGECQGKVSDILALSRVVPHFGERQTWSGEFDDTEPMSDAEIADAAFHAESAYLVGRLETDGCTMGPWASAASKPAPTAGVPVTDGIAAVEKAAREAFRDLKGYKQIAADYKDSGESGEWVDYSEEGVEPGRIEIAVMRHTSNKKLFVVARAHAGHGCGGFEGSLTAFFALSGSLEKPKLKTLYEAQSNLRIVAGLDIADNGTLGYIVEHFFYDTRLVGARGEALRSMSVAFFDCGC